MTKTFKKPNSFGRAAQSNSRFNVAYEGYARWTAEALVAGPQLTGSANDKLNERVLLRYLFEILSFGSRTVWPDVPLPRLACVTVRSGVRRPIP